MAILGRELRNVGLRDGWQGGIQKCELLKGTWLTLLDRTGEGDMGKCVIGI